MDGHQVVGAQEAGEVDSLNVVGILCVLAERDRPDDENQVAAIFFELDPGIGG